MSYIDPKKLLRPIVLITVLIVVGFGACALLFRRQSSVRYVYDKPGSIFSIGYWKRRGEAVVVTEGRSVQFWAYFSGHEDARGEEIGSIYGCTYLSPHGEKEFFYFGESYAVLSGRVPQDKIQFRVVSTAKGSIFGVVEESNPDVLLLAYEEEREILLNEFTCMDVHSDKSRVINALSEAAQTNLVLICDVPEERAETLLVR